MREAQRRAATPGGLGRVTDATEIQRRMPGPYRRIRMLGRKAFRDASVAAKAHESGRKPARMKPESESPNPSATCLRIAALTSK
jgi:hypothetical protein